MKYLIVILVAALSLNVFSEEENHTHDKGEAKHSDGDHKEEEGHEEAELPAGIVSFHDEEAEFTLRPNVIKNFGIESEEIRVENGFIKIPPASIVKSLDAAKIYIRKNETFKAVDIKIIKSENTFCYIAMRPDLKSVSIVTKGTNFLQTIMLSLEEGPSEGHGH